MKIKHFIFYIITSFIIFILIEVLSYFIMKLDVYKQDFYLVRDFTERVNDERYVSLKKNFSTKKKEFYQKEDWPIITSSLGTRISKEEIGSTKFLDETYLKVLFIGDSVPFGWGVKVESSIPYIFGKMNPNFVSINGAIPSYSLSQAVSRFIYEFKKIKNIKYVYLQVYDPAAQYGNLGEKWKEEDNWTNSKLAIPRNSFYFKFLNFKIPIYGNLNFLTIIKKIIINKFQFDNYFYLPTKESDIKFINHINKQLEKLLHNVNSIGAKLIIAPVTLPENKKAFDESYYTDSINYKYHLRAIKIFNMQIHQFINENDVIYIDTISILNSSKNSGENFIDSCCHLSAKGATKVSHNLSLLTKN